MRLSTKMGTELSQEQVGRRFWTGAFDLFVPATNEPSTISRLAEMTVLLASPYPAMISKITEISGAL